nr:glycosyltransferase [uncultured Roseateles sp.]
MTIADTQSRLIAVCLTTRNRPAMLAESLANLIDRLRPHGIPIHVSDNSTNDESSTVVRSLQAGYPFLHYSRCERDMAADENFERALHLPDTKYRWLFGDHYRIADDFDLRVLLSVLEADHELIALNSNNRIKGIASGPHGDPSFVLKELGWHLTMMTALIYSDRLLQRLDFKRYHGTFLSQTLSIFDEFARRKIDFFWLADIAIASYPMDPYDSWHPRALSVFVRDWFHGVMSLPPAYGTATKQVAIMAHASNVSLFSLRGMIYLRALGAVDLSKVKAVRKEVPFAFRLDRRIYLYCSLMIPRVVARLALKVYMKTRGGNTRHPTSSGIEAGDQR